MEKKKQKKEKSPSLGGNPFDNTDTQHATIGCGLYQEKLPVAGKTIGEIRKEFSDRLEIADNAVATVAGVEQGNDYRVGANELILFIQQAGEKGVKYKNLKQLKAAYESGELKRSCPLELDNDCAYVYVGDDKVYYSDYPPESTLLPQALRMLGIPSRGV